MELDLLEEFLLIALDDNKGQFVIDSTHLHYGFAGAILLELAMRDRIKAEGDNLILVGSQIEKEPALNKAIELIRKRKSGKIKKVVNALANKAGEFKQDTLERLINKGILGKREHKILWIIPSRKYPTQDLNPENKVRERLKAVMLHGAKSEPRDIMLLSLIDVSDLTKEAFRDKDDYERVKQDIKKVTQDVKISGAINKSIREVQAAIMIAVATTLIITTVTTVRTND